MADDAVGQQTPYDRNSPVSEAVFMVRQLIARINTMKPVKVVAVKPGAGSPPVAGTVDVQLLVSQIDGNGNAIKGSAGVLHGVPYLRLGGGAWAVVVDPAVGDVGLVICADRDISNVGPTLKSGAAVPVTPGSFRQYSISDAVYVGGCLNPVAPAQYVWLKGDGTFVIADGKGNVLSTSSSGFSLMGDLSVTGSITATKNVLAGGLLPAPGVAQVGLATHKHTANNTPPTPGT